MIDEPDHKHILLYSAATTIHGSEMHEEQLLTEALEKYEKKSYYVVSQWIIIDVILPLNAFHAMSCQNDNLTIIYALRAKRYEKGNFTDTHKLITGSQVSLDGCFFETEDALYILMGQGIRQSMSSQLVELLDTI